MLEPHITSGTSVKIAAIEDKVFQTLLLMASVLSYEENSSLQVQTCHLVWIVLDVLKHLGHKKITENEPEGFGIRSTSKCPEVDLKKKDKGGIHLSAPVSGKAM
ncbi:Developmentally-regulated GTP-binding protein 1 [Microtus ochrogaster]|uniref:Developmentally-regulated GTP-binding protein 1 n=1 Tax=Microtus ochrogaster TaxID=79684 RepID=A0A8J6GWL2_MICOH|nr:Developmentally-regulated GTP-binding protein 1 [Microtus ochrogaster]